jgi:integrase
VALRIQRRTWKTGSGSVSEGWRLIVEDYTHGKRRDLYPRREDYARYGLDPDDSYARAREKLTAVQARNRAERLLEKRARIEDRLSKEDLKESAYLPRTLYRRFLEWLQERRVWDKIPSKTESHLRAMRKLVLEVGVDPSDWPERPERIYRWFLSKKLSLSYVDKVLPLLNDYGYFYCREFKKPFVPIPAPRGDVARRIDDANQDEREGSQAASHPLEPGHLVKLEPLGDARLRWVRLSLYFGLRPSEVDELVPVNRGRIWEARKDDKGTWVLHFYQRKLVRLERSRRWKRIPCVLKEQADLLQEILHDMKLDRPYHYNLSDALGPGYGLYAGRKGFEKLMRGKGQRGDNISRWLGHRDVTTTERHYREAEAVEYDPVPESPARPADPEGSGQAPRS